MKPISRLTIKFRDPMGWVGAAGEIPQRLPLLSPQSTQVSVSPLLQVCQHVNIVLNPPCLCRVQHGRSWERLSLLRPHLIPKTKPGLFQNCSKFESIQSRKDWILFNWRHRHLSALPIPTKHKDLVSSRDFETHPDLF